MSAIAFQGSGQKSNGPGANQEPRRNDFYVNLFVKINNVNTICALAIHLVKEALKNKNHIEALFQRAEQIKIPKEFVKNCVANASSGIMVGMIALNIPLRAIGIYKAFQEKKYVYTTLHVVAFASLFFSFQYGWGVSIVVAIAAVFYDKFKSNSSFPDIAPNPIKPVIKLIAKIPDPVDLENAAKILDVGLDSGRADIVKNYKNKIQYFATKMDGKSGIDGQIQGVMKVHQSAYRTLLSRLEEHSTEQEDHKLKPRTIDFKAACEILEIENGLHSDREHIVKKYQTKIHNLSEKMDGTSSKDDRLQLTIEEVQVAYEILATELTDSLA